MIFLSSNGPDRNLNPTATKSLEPWNTLGSSSWWNKDTTSSSSMSWTLNTNSSFQTGIIVFLKILVLDLCFPTWSFTYESFTLKSLASNTYTYSLMPKKKKKKNYTSNTIWKKENWVWRGFKVRDLGLLLLLLMYLYLFEERERIVCEAMRRHWCISKRTQGRWVSTKIWKPVEREREREGSIWFTFSVKAKRGFDLLILLLLNSYPLCVLCLY